MNSLFQAAAPARAMILALALAAVGGGGTAQAQICVYVDTYDDMARLSGNTVQGSLEHWLSGPCMYDWSPVIWGWVYRDEVLLQTSGQAVWGGPGGAVSYTFPALWLSQEGPGVYIALGLHAIFCPWEICGYDRWEPPYDDNWDGYDWWTLPVVRPTISGWGSGGAMWYLGDGTATQVLAQDGNYYYQAYDLTFNDNCNPWDTCEDTPGWTITTDPGVPEQAWLNRDSGYSVTINSGPNTGNCEWNTTVTASIGGFATEEYYVAVNSPSHLVAYTSYDHTLPQSGGYVSRVYWAVADTCQAPNALLGLPLHETFGQFSNPGVVSGWPDPQATSAPNFNYSYYIFYDSVGAYGAYDPAPVYTSSNPPFTYSTVIKYAPQSWRVGTQNPGGGTEVFSGTITYYQDHGTSQ